MGIALSAMIPALPLGRAALGVDYTVFWEAAGRPIDALYLGDPDQPFVNPPTSLLLFGPLSLFDRNIGFAMWTAASLILYFVAFAQLFPRFAVALSLLSPLLIWAIWLGQSTVILSAMIAGGIALGPVAGGALLGIALVIKPQILWLAPFVLLMRRDWHRLSAMAAAAMMAVIAVTVAFGYPVWFDWLASIPMFRAAAAERGILAGTISFGSQAHQLGPVAVILYVAAALTLAGLAIVRFSRGATSSTLLLLMIGCSALAAPYSLPHDLLALLPVAIMRISESRHAIERILAASFYCGLLVPVALLAALGQALLSQVVAHKQAGRLEAGGIA